MTTAPLGVALIGYAFMGRAHSNAWRNVSAIYPHTPPIRRQVIVGRNGDQVAAAASSLGWAESASDWEQVISRPDIDIVDICTPGSLHAPVAIAALTAGKHVIIEKPLANTLGESEEIAQVACAAQPRGVQAMVGFNYRRVPALALARTMIAEGRIGTPRQVRVSYLQDWLVDERSPMTWRLRKEHAGSGVLGDLGAHAVDQAQWLLGEHLSSVSGRLRTFVPQRPAAAGALERVTVDDAAWAWASTASGVAVSLEVSRMASGRKNALEVEVYGSSGGLRFDLERLNELQHTGLTGPVDQQGWTTTLVTESSHPYLDAWWPPGHVLGWDHTFTTQAAEFLHAIATGTPCTPSIEDGLQVQRVLDAIEVSSAADGRTVDLN